MLQSLFTSSENDGARFGFPVPIEVVRLRLHSWPLMTTEDRERRALYLDRINRIAQTSLHIDMPSADLLRSPSAIRTAIDRVIFTQARFAA